MSSFQKFLQELVATGALTFVVAGATIINTVTGGSFGLLGLALSYGLITLIMGNAAAHEGGIDMNPAITLARWGVRRISSGGAIWRIIAQLVGAAVGAWLLTKIVPGAVDIQHLGTPTLASFVGTRSALLVEALMTAIIVWAAFGASNKRSGISTGAAYAVGALFAMPLTGAGLNPARVFGSAFVSGYWINHWIYWIGPLVGALAAGYWYKITAGSDESK